MKTGQTIGSFFELGSCNAIECLARTGLDYIVIDFEHGCFSDESAANYIRAAENTGLIPYVRISDTRRASVLRMLDIGARGLIVPNITSMEQVCELVSHGKFPPVGNRGYCPTRTSGWGQDKWSKEIHSYMAECNQRCLMIPQCETKEALEQIEEIAALEGVDGIFVGPCDLSISLGSPWKWMRRSFSVPSRGCWRPARNTVKSHIYSLDLRRMRRNGWRPDLTVSFAAWMPPFWPMPIKPPLRHASQINRKGYLS